MTIYSLYIIFGLTTAISSLYEIFWPIVRDAKALGVINEITIHPYLSSFIFLIIQFVFAPLVLIVLLVPSLHKSAVKGLQREIERENPDLK